MPLIKIDMSEMETIRVLMIAACTKCEGIVNRIGVLKSMMETDPQFLLLPQSAAVIDSVDNSLKNLCSTSMMLSNLRNSIIETPEKFAADEDATVKSIEELTSKLDRIASNMVLIMSEDEEKKKESKT